MRRSSELHDRARIRPGYPTARSRRALSGLVPILLALSLSPLSAQQPPDIVLIQTDDQPHHSMPFLPLTDSLIGRAGAQFKRYFVSTSVCGPSRATTLTGQYSHNHGVMGNSRAASRLDTANTLAVWLQAAGYRTALVGKYLNGYDDTFPSVPPGWSHWRAFRIPAYWNFTLSEDGVAVAYDSSAVNYATFVLRDHAVAFIESTPGDTPLFLYFTPNAPHMPADPALEDGGSFDGLPRWSSRNYNEADVRDKPQWVRELDLADDQLMAEQHQRIAESLQAIDRSVAEIVAALRRTGRLRRTLVIFTSDNGWALGGHRWTMKMCVYEECSREPLLVRGPGIAAGRVIGRDKLVDNTDLAATIVDYAGARPSSPLDGRSFRPLLENRGASWTDPVLLELRGQGQAGERRFSAIRTAQHMYAEYDNGDRELYDLARDPWQLESVANDPAYAAVQAELALQLQSLRGSEGPQPADVEDAEEERRSQTAARR